MNSAGRPHQHLPIMPSTFDVCAMSSGQKSGSQNTLPCLWISLIVFRIWGLVTAVGAATHKESVRLQTQADDVPAAEYSHDLSPEDV